MRVEILKQHNLNGWITCLAENRWFQAKVYDEPSNYGVNNCRVSKMAVAKEGVKLLGLESGLDFFDNLDYNYDRGLDFHNDTLSQDYLDGILDWLNNLPKLSATP